MLSTSRNAGSGKLEAMAGVLEMIRLERGMKRIVEKRKGKGLKESRGSTLPEMNVQYA